VKVPDRTTNAIPEGAHMPRTSHRAYVSSHGRGYGRYSHTWTCTCGARGGDYNSDSAAQTAARKHEKNGR